ALAPGRKIAFMMPPRYGFCRTAKWTVHAHARKLREYVQIKFAPDKFVEPGRGAVVAAAAPLSAGQHQRRFDTAPHRDHAECKIRRQYAGAVLPRTIAQLLIAADALLDKLAKPLRCGGFPRRP